MNPDEFNETMELLFEEKRLGTFKKWVYSDEHQCNAKKMAEAGFIFMGSKHEPDVAQCFLCNKSLDGWESDDDPWQEHLKHSPNCAFAKLQQPEDALTVYQFADLAYNYNTVLVKQIYGDQLSSLDKWYENLKNKYNKLK